jgi:hypothetical protein
MTVRYDDLMISKEVIKNKKVKFWPEAKNCACGECVHVCENNKHEWTGTEWQTGGGRNKLIKVRCKFCLAVKELIKVDNCCINELKK